MKCSVVWNYLKSYLKSIFSANQQDFKMHGHRVTPDIDKKKINESHFKIILQLWPYLWPKNMLGVRLRLIISFSALILGKIILLGVPLFYKKLIDQLSFASPEHIGTTSLKIVLGLLFGYAAARFLAVVFNEVRDAIFAPITQRALRHIALNVFKHLHELSLRYHILRQTGGLSRSIERGTKSIESLLHFMLIIIIPTFIEVTLSGILLWWLYGPLFSLIMVITITFYTFFTLRLTQWRTHLVRQMNASDQEAQNKAIESLLNYETVKYFSSEKREEARFEDSLVNYEKAAIKNKISLFYLNVGQTFITTAGLIGMMYLAANNIMAHIMTVGDFAAVNTLLMQLYIPLFNLGFAYREVKMALVNMEDMFTLLKEPKEIIDSPNAKNLQVQSGKVEFKDVTFFYEPTRQILDHLSFKIPAGKTLAIVGTTGAGKSTIAKLLFRFYEPQQGNILIDGEDIRTVTQKSLRGVIGVVPQDTVLFNQSIYYNIAYGHPDATPEMVDQAAKDAQIYDFIMSLPEKYETRVGERGLKLSGGEKQRIAIARVLVKNPKIFIFDEATSSLDMKTEMQIKQSLDIVSEKKTTLVIAHRLSTVINADEIIVLDKGKIAEKGNHAELIKLKGLYAQLWRQQEKEALMQAHA